MITVPQQGLGFSVAAMLFCCVSFLTPPVNGQLLLISCSLVIVFFGVPHGALDPVFAKSLLRLHTFTDWLAFVFAYLSLSLLVIVFWWCLPTAFLLGFLLVSIFHFSGDLAPGSSFATRLLYGACSVVLPAALYSDELTRLFSFLVRHDHAVLIVSVLYHLSWPWFVAVLLESARNYRKKRVTSIEVCAVAVCTLVLSPLVGFTLFFCGMHSLRHWIQTHKYSGLSVSFLALISAVPLAAVCAFAVGAWVLLLPSALDERIIQFVFVGLAALTVPHMFLVERVRFNGWRPL